MSPVANGNSAGGMQRNSRWGVFVEGSARLTSRHPSGRGVVPTSPRTDPVGKSGADHWNATGEATVQLEGGGEARTADVSSPSPNDGPAASGVTAPIAGSA